MRSLVWCRASFAALLALGLMAAGCTNENSQITGPGSPSTQQGANLTEQNGGYTTANEPSGFGDQVLVNSANEEVSFDDPIGRSPEFSTNVPSDMRLFALTITWGKLQTLTGGAGQGGNADLYDWSGTLEISRGGVVVQTVIGWEREDSLFRSAWADLSTRKRSLNWVSHTGEDFDGLRTLIFQPGLKPGATDDTLTFTTGMLAAPLLFSMKDLSTLDSLIVVDDQGNKVRFQAFQTQVNGSPARGFLRGRWDAISAGDSLGYFKGIWVSDRGLLRGFLRGHYGTTKAGEKVFFGKFIDRSGSFQGILRGKWGVRDGVVPGILPGDLGWFAGRWVEYADGIEGHSGLLRGRWHSLPDRPGFFDGRWCGDCPPDNGL